MAILAAELRPTLSCLLVDGFSPSSSSPVLVSQHPESKRKIRSVGQCPPTRLHPCPGSALIAAVDGFAAVSEGRATSSPLEEAGR
jgi:hypothetical protein